MGRCRRDEPVVPKHHHITAYRRSLEPETQSPSPPKPVALPPSSVYFLIFFQTRLRPLSFHIGPLSRYFHHISPSSSPIQTHLVLLESDCQDESSESKIGRFGPAVVEIVGFYPLCGRTHIFLLFSLFYVVLSVSVRP